MQTYFTAEISIPPITTNKGDRSISKEIALVYHSIYHIQWLKTILTHMSTQVESNNLDNILKQLRFLI